MSEALSDQATASQPGSTESPAGTPEGTARWSSSMRGRFETLLERYALLALLGVEVLIFGVLKPETFLTSGNLQTILSSQAVLMIVTLGLVLTLSAGEFDLSAGFVVAFSGVMLGKFTLTWGVPAVPAIALTLVCGILIGAVNALVVVRLHVNSFIATLGTGTILSGLALLLTNSEVLSGISPQFTDVMRTKIWSIPLPVFIGLACAALMWIFLEHTTGGRRLIFTGLGSESAKLSGVRVEAVRASALIGCSFLAALAGVVLTGRMGAASPTSGPEYLLPAFAAAFLGATTFKPGRFNAWGSVVALYVLITGITGLQLLGATAWVQPVFNGTALVVAVALSQLTLRSRQVQE